MWKVWERRFGAGFLAIGGTILLVGSMRWLDGWDFEWWAALVAGILLLTGALMVNGEKNDKPKS